MSREDISSCLIQYMEHPHPPRVNFLNFERYSDELYSRRHKRIKTSTEGRDSRSISYRTRHAKANSKMKTDLGNSVDYSDPFSVPNLMEELDRGIYGSVTKDIEDLLARKLQMLNPLLALHPSLSSPRMNSAKTSHLASQDIIDLDDDCVLIDAPALGISRPFCSTTVVEMTHSNNSVVIIDSDEEDGVGRVDNRCDHSYDPGTSNVGLLMGSQIQSLYHVELDRGKNFVNMISRDAQYFQPENNMMSAFLEANRKASCGFHQQALLKKLAAEKPSKDLVNDHQKNKAEIEKSRSLDDERPSEKSKGEYVGVQDDLMSDRSGDQSSSEDDGYGDMWREMTLMLECSKDAAPENSVVEHSAVVEEGDDCDHSFVLKDDLGYVCRICGVINKKIEMIFDFQWSKGSKTTRTYPSESRGAKDREQHEATPFSIPSASESDFAVGQISVHPRHMKKMKPHQLEGFNFLLRNLMSDKPGGCILAHAPGSGKTFMIISFMQSFLAKYPSARPLVVLPKGILGTWKKEFQRWQVEDIPLFDFYSAKADNRTQQLDVLKEWVDNKGIMFLGYKQFANIVSGSISAPCAASCQDILLKVPTILIMDEGHTPRNENTDVLLSISRVQTPRKVVLSGTLFQNHVKEVFNIFNLVRPKFMKLETSRAVIRRVMSRVQIAAGRRQAKSGGDTLFYDMVEETLQKDDDFKRKVTVIQDLREMTREVLHYYKGDFLDELPGLVDLTVLLSLNPRQKSSIEKLRKLEKFKRTSMCSAVYVHPQLKEFSESSTTSDKGWNVNDDKIDRLLNNVDVKEGVKTKFFLNLLALCESAGEKLLVFSQYLLPLKFLERVVIRTKGWSPGKEIFVISGDSSAEHRERSMESFNNSPDAKVFFGSIKACGEGISLVGASRLLILDVHLNPSVTRQAIGRAFRPGQVKKVYAYRLIAADSPEEEDHATCFRKELISKMWFEWSEYSGHHVFEMEKVDSTDLDDIFWESPSLAEDVKSLYKR